MFIYSRLRKAYLSSIHLDAFDLRLGFTNERRKAIECDISFYKWLRKFDAFASYDLVFERLFNYE